MSDVSLSIAFVVLDVLIATFPPPPPPFKVILRDNLSTGAIIGVGDYATDYGSTRFHRNSDALNFTNSSGNLGVSADLVWGGDGRLFCDFI